MGRWDSSCCLFSAARECLLKHLWCKNKPERCPPLMACGSFTDLFFSQSLSHFQPKRETFINELVFFPPLGMSIQTGTRTVSWSECSFSACCRAGGWLCMSQIWRDPGTVVQLWPELTDSPAVICHPKAEKHSGYYGKTVTCFKNVERTRHPGDNLRIYFIWIKISSH